jgi:hypothetical protein
VPFEPEPPSRQEVSSRAPSPGPRRATCHSGGTGPVAPSRAISVATVSRSSRRAPSAMSMASGISAKIAESRLNQMPLVPQSSVRSNQASQHSSVAVTIRHTISNCLPRHAVHATAANASSSATSKPTQAPRQPPELYRLGSVTASTPIQAARKMQQPIARVRASFRRLLAFGSLRKRGASRAARVRARRARCSGLIIRSSASLSIRFLLHPRSRCRYPAEPTSLSPSHLINGNAPTEYRSSPLGL